MKTTRRNFIFNSVFAGGGIVVFPLASWFGISRRDKKFDLEIGVCSDFAKGDLLKGFGYSYIEEGVQKYLAPPKGEEEFLKNLESARSAALPIKACNSFLPSILKCVGPETDHAAILKFADTAFRRAQIAGVKIIVFGSGGARKIPEGFPRREARIQFITLCKQMAPIAGKYKVKVVLEPLNSQECNFINSVAEGGEIVKEVNHPNFLLLADIYHMKKESENPENIVKYGHFLHHIHIAEKEGRSAPGTNHDDFTEYFRALKKIRYRGMISVECNWQNMEEQLPVTIQTIRTQLEW